MSFKYFNSKQSRLGLVLGATLLASPVAAQSICGGMGDGGAWIGGIEAASDLSTSAGPFDTSGFIPANSDMISLFNLSAAADIRVEAMPGDGGDTVIDLIDGNGNLVLSDDDGGGGLASRGEINLQPGTYCLVTRGIEGSQANVDVRIGRQDHAALTVGTTMATDLEACTSATITEPLARGGIGGALPVSRSASANATPYYGFEVDHPTALTFTASNEDADPVLYLYDENGAVIAENDDTNGLNSRIDMTDPLQPGSYCLGVRALSNSDLPITVEVSEFNESDYLNSLYSSGETSPPLDGSYPVEDLGILETRSRVDVRLADGVSWYQVELFDGDLIVAEAIAVGEVDPTLVIFDDLGREIGRNDDNGTNLDSLIAAPIQPGVYLIGVGQVGDQSAGVVRLALQRYVRARN